MNRCMAEKNSQQYGSLALLAKRTIVGFQEPYALIKRTRFSFDLIYNFQ
jgi:hypothetical protein